MRKAWCRIPSSGNDGNAELAGRFLAYVRDGGFSPKTVEARRNGLRKLLVFLGAGPLREVSAADLDRYRLSLVEQDFSAHSIEQYLRTVRILFDWLEDQCLLFLNPARTLVIPKPPRRVRWILSEGQVHALLALPDPSRPEGLRDRALIEVAYATAVRRQELTAMSMYDLDLKQAAVRVLGKGRKERMLPLGRNGVRHLENYLRHGRSKLLKDSIDCPALWISRRTRRGLTDDGIAQIIEKLGRHAELPHALTCHVFRRTCASEMLRNGAHPESVRMLLGHSSLKTLAQYLCISIADVRRMHGRGNPGK